MNENEPDSDESDSDEGDSCDSGGETTDTDIRPTSNDVISGFTDEEEIPTDDEFVEIFENEMTDQLDPNLFVNGLNVLKTFAGNERELAGMDEMDLTGTDEMNVVVEMSEIHDIHYPSVSDGGVDPSVIVNVNFVSFKAAMKLFSAQCTAENLDTNPQGKLGTSKQRTAEDKIADDNFGYNEETQKFTPQFIYNLDELSKLEDGRLELSKRSSL